MKFVITMKDPDGSYDCISEAAQKSIKAIAGLSDSEQELLLDGRREEIEKVTGLFLEYGEYIHVEIDTELRTARVLSREEWRR